MRSWSRAKLSTPPPPKPRSGFGLVLRSYLGMNAQDGRVSRENMTIVRPRDTEDLQSLLLRRLGFGQRRYFSCYRCNASLEPQHRGARDHRRVRKAGEKRETVLVQYECRLRDSFAAMLYAAQFLIDGLEMRHDLCLDSTCLYIHKWQHPASCFVSIAEQSLQTRLFFFFEGREFFFFLLFLKGHTRD